MNRLTFIILFFALGLSQLGVSDPIWSPEHEKLKLVPDHQYFIEINQKLRPELLNALDKFKKAVFRRDFDYIYSIRPSEFKKIVSLDVFKRVYGKNIHLPSKIYYSQDRSNFSDKQAEIRSVYIQSEIPNVTYSVESIDKWKLDSNSQQWMFVSNQLSWGSSVLVDEPME
jgi:hypothetical protein